MTDHYPILNDGVKLRIHGDMLKTITAHPLPIHWNNRGLVGVIPVERVINALEVLKDQTKRLNAIDPDIGFEQRLYFYWGETELLNEGEESSNEGTQSDSPS